MAITIDKSQGYVIMWRSIMDTAIFTNPKLVALYNWVLLRANWEQKEVFENTDKVVLRAGQFITSLDKVAKVIKMKSIVSAKNYLNVLKHEGIIEIKTTNKYTIVTVLNWKDLQNFERFSENKIKTEWKQNETDNTYKSLNTITHTEKTSLSPLSKEERFKIALDLRVDLPDVKSTMDDVLDPENIRKYKVKDVSRTVRSWLKRSIKLGQQRTLDEYGMMILKGMYQNFEEENNATA